MAEEKSTEAVIAEVDPSYAEEMKQLEEEYLKNEVALSQLIERKKTLVQNIEDELSRLEEKANPSVEKREALEKQKRKASVSIGEWEQTAVNKQEKKKVLKDKLAKEAGLSSKQRDLINRQPTTEQDNQEKVAALEQIIETAEEYEETLSDPVERKIVQQIKQDQKEARQKASVEFGEIDQSSDPLSAVNESSEKRLDQGKRSKVKKNRKKVQQLQKEQSELKKELASENNERKRRQINKNIEQLNEDIAEEQVAILDATTKATEEELQKELSTLEEQKEGDNSGTSAAKTGSIKSQRLLKEAAETDDPVRKAQILGNAQRQQEKAITQTKKEQSRKKAQILIGEVVSENNLDLNPEKTMRTENQLTEEREQIGIQRVEIDDEITRIEALQKQLKPKEAKKFNPVKKELEQLDQSLKNKEQQIDEQLNTIADKDQKDKAIGVDEESMNTSVSYEEEVGIAADSSYKALAQMNNQLKQQQYELEIKKQELENSKSELQRLTEAIDHPEDPSTTEKSNLKEQLATIAKQKEDVENYRQQVQNTQQAMREALPENTAKRTKYENLIARDVAPIKEIPSLPVKTKGLIIGTSEQPAYSNENPIPLEEEQPKGLIYRVQIGAFSNPVPNETFEEFSPISGEQIENSGLIRYMAGYFGSRGSATSARERIREMGYSDAFVVAYCDGERIPVYRAEQLRASGACVPAIETNEQPILTAEEANEGAANGSFDQELDKFAYNKAPGAAEAEAAESKMGLYFTVQVGVYNTPVTSEQLYNVSPLVTKRLDNGQIRYSSGVFNSVERAREKQQNVIEKGITDAFVVAYYKGKRLMASEAINLLEKQGESILELKNPTKTKRNKIQNNQALPESERLPYLRDKKLQYQLMDATYYDSFPTQVLNRYNSEKPLFYYDASSERVKSRLLTKKAQQTVRNNFPEMTVENIYYEGRVVRDTAAIHLKEAIDTASQIYRLKIDSLNKLNSDRWDIIWNNSLLKSIDVANNEVKIMLYSSATEELNKIASQLRKIGVSTISIDEVHVKTRK